MDTLKHSSRTALKPERTSGAGRTYGEMRATTANSGAGEDDQIPRCRGSMPRRPRSQCRESREGNHLPEPADQTRSGGFVRSRE